MKMLTNNLYTFLFIMFTISFLIQYFIMSWVMSNSIINIRNSLGKFYLSVLMGLFMVLIELLMTESLNIFLYLIIIVLIGLTIYFYRNQIFIGEKEYLSEMIEHHSMAILTSEEILKKTENAEVANLANRIIQAQTKEIQEIRNLL